MDLLKLNEKFYLKTQSYFNRSRQFPWPGWQKLLVYLQGSSLKVIVAVPVAAKDSAQRLKKLVDQWLCLFEPDDLAAVGQFYEEFGQVSDEEVVKLLQ